MRINISGIGRIGNSEIEIKGISVIAGKNFTGKSTVGKALYCMFNAFCNAKTTIRDERINAINRVITHNIPISRYNLRTARTANRFISKLIDEVEKTTIDGESRDNLHGFIADEIQQIIDQQDASRIYDTHDNIVNNIVNNIYDSLGVSDNELQKYIIDSYFANEFYGKVNHVDKPDLTGSVSLIIKDKNVSVDISNNKCRSFVDNVGIWHNAIYIDTPFVIDDDQQLFLRHSSARYSRKMNHRGDLRRRLAKGFSNNTAIEEVIVNKKISDVLSKIHPIVSGEFVEDRDGLMFKEKSLVKPLPLSIMSAGIKTFLIIKRLLELGGIKEHDVLIFDEPENHLHPAWQLGFAELLVLMQKEFNLTILLATHSPYFLNAIEAYSEKHGIKEERVKFYLAENNGDTSDVRDVTDNVDVIYKQLAEPLRILDDMEYGD